MKNRYERYEIRDASKSLGKFDIEEEVENFFFRNGKMMYSLKEIKSMWIISDGKYGWWSMGADNYIDGRGCYFIPYVPYGKLRRLDKL